MYFPWKQLLDAFKLNNSDSLLMPWNAGLILVKTGRVYPSSERAVERGQQALICLMDLMSR